MKISDIIYREEILLCEIDDELEFNSIRTNPDELERGDILFLLKPSEANALFELSTMPIAVVCDTNAILPDFIPSIRVENPRAVLANACYRFEKIDQSKTKIIGVTGTNGKTSTATMIKKILYDLGHKVGFIGTGKIEIDGKIITDRNYSMTTPDPPLLYNSIKQMVEYGCEYIVMEVSSHALALSKLEPLKFDVAIFTNISPEHLDFHGDMNSYFAAKYSLLKKSKCVIINIDDKYGRKAQNEYEGKKITVGVLWRADVWASNVDDHGFDGISYTYHADGFSFKMRMPIPGKYNVYNSMLAAAACIELGCKPCEVKEKLATFSGVEGRYEIINDKIMVIIDYAHTYFAFESFLSSLSANKNGRRLTVVFGCGGNRDKAKRPLMAKVAEKYADRIILTADNSRKESTKDIISDIIRGFEKGSYEIKEDRTDAIRTAILESKDGEIVALIGKGPEKYNIDSLGYHYFSEKDIIFSALDERAKRCGQCE